MIRCIAFDFDGTLVDSNAAKRRAFYDVLLPLGLAESQIDGIFRDSPDADRHGIMAEAAGLLRQVGVEINPGDLADQYGIAALKAQVSAPELPGAALLLESLCGKMSLYLNSATPEAALRQAIEARGWGDFFHGIYGRPSDKTGILLRIAEREDLPPSDILMVGDNEADEQAARKVGCAFVATGSLTCPAYGERVENLMDIPAVIERNLAYA